MCIRDRSYLALQVLVHGEPLMGEYLRSFVPWIFALIITQTLAQYPGFLQRFALFASAMGLALLPYLRTSINTLQFQRAGLDTSVTLANPNDLGAWFGFCAVYFVIVGLETSRAWLRIICGMVVLGCLYIVTMTLSRGSLLAVMVATLVALRSSLKQGLVPILVLSFLVWVFYQSGVFDTAIAAYSVRATEESGRFRVWPLALERFLDAWLIGVGATNIETYTPASFKAYSPHNSFLFFALVSGIIPTVFFTVYWWQAFRGAVRTQSTGTADAPFVFPMVVYSLLVSLASNTPFMAPWVTATLATALAGNVVRLPQGKSRQIYQRRRRVTATATYERGGDTSLAESSLGN